MMKVFRCEEMMCGHCVSRIDTALNEAGIAHKTELETKTVTIQDDASCGKAVEILDDLGFSAVEQ